MRKENNNSLNLIDMRDPGRTGDCLPYPESGLWCRWSKALDLLVSILIVLNVSLAVALFFAKMDRRDRMRAERVRAKQEYKSHFRRD